MPLKTIKICPRCEKKTCDGSVWREISIVPTEGPNKGKEMLDNGNHIGCGLQSFMRGTKIPQGPVGTKAIKYYPKWLGKTLRPNVTYEKIEE